MKKSKKIKVCHIASVDITLRFMLLNKLRFLKNEGYEVYGICSPGKWVKDIEKEGIKVKTIRFKRKISPFSDWIAFLKLLFYFRKEKFQIVHTHTLKPEFYGQIAAKLAGVPIIINTIHGFDFVQDDPSWKKQLFVLLGKIAARYSDHIFSISHKIIDEAIKYHIAKPEILSYLGRDINTSRFDPMRFPPEFVERKKRTLGISNQSLVVGIVGRLVVEKGFLDLFIAFREIVKKFPEAILLVIGSKEPEKRDALKPNIVKEYGITEHVLFLGERVDLEELYAVMDVFVLPTYREGLGAVILEASAMARPVIASAVGGCPEAVDNGRTGILVPPKNPKLLAQALLFLLENPKKRKEMGNLGREKILKEFSQDLVFQRMREQYRNLIRQKLSREVVIL